MLHRCDNMDPIDAYRLGQEARKAAGTESEQKNHKRNAGRPGKPAMWQLIFGSVAGIAFVCMFLAGFLGGRFTLDDLIWVCPAVLGTVLFFVGMAIYMHRRSKYILIIPGFGFVAAFVAILFGVAGESFQEILFERIVPFVMLLGLSVGGLCLSIIPRYRQRQNEMRFTREVRATVIDKQSHMRKDSDGRWCKSWTLIWKYNPDGTERIYRSRISKERERREIGDTGVLYLHPTDPDQAWEKDEAGVRALSIVGGIFTVFGLGGLVSFFMSL